ncbi:hypothetical protein [Pseudoalteromonas ruthenica]|uniref:Lysozyme n=1 Tax=Pseudoalteromonas ruthenica TaxID=151081 RepID=A0A0F4PIZ3_9GAMM|nr:hypothetical protein [Pseudoalteromonas ruthenica]KJY95382.1 hypothetical protein TW72_18300 [Pseudoalteromonas ruthenica]KJY96193.1 hypothetical protein TW76_12210 [Pseudoalteromonas ruthenica]TMO84940.1 hypothetical protein CWC12_18070 [Pseudoalteromonas ruthenica]TMO92257.1 hypothetical protein CWC13_11670 [Pseudoalteromonas ruthenica]TMO95815.1 hypothetical protein CWC07_18900 [Pseudoalteromonas ruthenica]
MSVSQRVRKEVIDNLIKYENKIKHFYLDSEGYVTIGVGHLVPDKGSASQLLMYKVNENGLGVPATVQDKQKEFETVSKQRRNYKAGWYKQFTNLEMKELDIDNQLNKHFDSFYRDLVRIYKKSNGYIDDFDNFDKAVQVALFDMIFNLGAHKIVNIFKEFDSAIKAGDWTKAAQESYRYQLSPERNKYVKAKLLSATQNITVLP